MQYSGHVHTCPKPVLQTSWFRHTCPCPTSNLSLPILPRICLVLLCADLTTPCLHCLIPYYSVAPIPDKVPSNPSDICELPSNARPKKSTVIYDRGTLKISIQQQSRCRKLGASGEITGRPNSKWFSAVTSPTMMIIFASATTLLYFCSGSCLAAATTRFYSRYPLL